MRISDWSSDVCSSDLEGREAIEIIAPDLRIVADEPERIPVGGLDQPFRPDRILVELIDVSTVEEVLAPAVALDRHEGGNVRCNVVGQTSCQICLPRDGVIICISQIEVPAEVVRSEEHTSELQSLMRISYAFFCLKNTNNTIYSASHNTHLYTTT